ncbi:MAG TPA: hypothetical protein VL155_04730 [Terriglobales bacterium]|nr:hypothetical protein [Terriglobales bacterium]
MNNIVSAKSIDGQPAAPPATPFMKAEAVKRAYLPKLHALLAAYDRDISAALAGLQDNEYRLAEQKGYRWRLTRGSRDYFRPWND